MSGGYLHVVSDDGVYTCYDPKTGEVKSQKQLARHVSGSPVATSNRIFIVDDDGRITVIEIGPDCKIVATNKLDDEIFSTPAPVGVRLVVRAAKHLYCFGASAESTKTGSIDSPAKR
jgi:outer membrane protein assembly factor BamB